MLVFDVLLAALVGSLYGYIASLGEKLKWGVVAFVGYAGMLFAASCGFVLILGSKL